MYFPNFSPVKLRESMYLYHNAFAILSCFLSWLEKPKNVSWAHSENVCQRDLNSLSTVKKVHIVKSEEGEERNIHMCMVRASALCQMLCQALDTGYLI